MTNREFEKFKWELETLLYDIFPRWSVSFSSDELTRHINKIIYGDQDI